MTDGQAQMRGNTGRTRNRIRSESRVMLVIAYAVLLVLTVIALAPLAWTVLTSFKDIGEIYSGSVWPTRFDLTQYRRLFAETNFLLWMGNSLIVAVGSTALGLLVSLMAGYAFAKYDFFLKRALFVIIIVSIAIPAFATVVPMFGWIDTYQVLILPFAANAFGVFLMTQYMRDIPNDLLDAARIDGCGELMILPRIVLPLVRPALGATGILLFLNSWNSFIWPLIMTRTNKMATIPLGLASLNSLHYVEYGMLMAGALISVIPMLVLFALLHRQFIEGLTHGAVKG